MPKGAGQKIDAKKQCVFAFVEMIRYKTFYGHIIQQLQKNYIEEEDHPIKTMAVGKMKGEMLLKFYASMPFVRELYEKASSDNQAFEQIMSIVEHEILHIIFDHLSLTFSDKLRGNIAVDCAVNSYLDKNKMPEGTIWPENYGLERNKSAFWYYQKLQDNKQFQKDCADGKFGMEGMFGDAINSHKMWEEVAKDPFAKEMIKDVMRKAKELAQSTGYGNLPNDILQQVEDMLKGQKPKVPWNRLLRQYVASSSESNLDWTMKRESRRFGTKPGTRKEDVLRICVIRDTSGSVGDHALTEFNNEIHWIWKNGAQVFVMDADVEVHQQYEYRGKYKQLKSVKGRGGTCFDLALQQAEDGRFDVVVYLTDFEAPKVKRHYRVNAIWVIDGNQDMDPSNYPADWGRKIFIDTNDKQ